MKIEPFSTTETVERRWYYRLDTPLRLDQRPRNGGHHAEATQVEIIDYGEGDPFSVFAYGFTYNKINQTIGGGLSFVTINEKDRAAILELIQPPQSENGFQ